MKQLFVVMIGILAPLLACGQNGWKDLAVTENLEYYIDTTSVKMVDTQTYATVKTVYLSPESQQAYLAKIKRVFGKNGDKKIQKWNNFAYTITSGLYDCTNKRFKILQVSDYTADDKLIIKTKNKETQAPWLQVEADTVGDHVLFYICDEAF